MALTFAEALEKLELLKQQRAVWHELEAHLKRFVDHEVSKADHVIPAEGCVSQDVPKEVIEAFIEEIDNNEIEPLSEQIAELESMTVTETKKDGKDKGNTKKAKPKGSAKANPQQKATGAKGIRAVPAPARLKGGGAS